MSLATTFLASGLFALSQSPCDWTLRSPAPEPRVEGQSAVVQGRLLTFGGFYDAPLHVTSRVDAYDPSTDAWSPLADMPRPVTHHALAVDGTNVWIAGGFLGDNGGPVVADVLLYDAATDTWLPAPSLPSPRAGGGLAVLGRGLHFVGGFSSRLAEADTHWVLDLDDPWSGWDTGSFAPLPTGRGHLACAQLDGKLYAIGGQLGHDVNPTDLDLVDAWDPATGTWSPAAKLPFPRSHFEASTFLSGGRIVIAGGRNNQPGGEPALRQVTAYDPALDRWIDVQTLPAPMIGGSVKAIGTRLYSTCGGSSTNVPQAANWSRDFTPVLGADLRVNAGGGSLQIAQTWCGDGFYSGGESYTATAMPAIANTVDDALYWSEHTGTLAEPLAFSYHFPVEPGNYRLRLHFAEIFWTQPGKRVFDVRVEGETVLDDLDLVARVGATAALVSTFDTHVADGSLDLELEATVDRPKISAIEVVRLADDAIELLCPSAASSIGIPPRLGFVGSISVGARDFRLAARDLPPGSVTIFGVSLTQANLPFRAGTICLGFPLTQTSNIHISSSTGSVDLRVPLGTQYAPVGATWTFQAVHQDTWPFPMNVTNALEITFDP